MIFSKETKTSKTVHQPRHYHSYCKRASLVAYIHVRCVCGTRQGNSDLTTWSYRPLTASVAYHFSARRMCQREAARRGGSLPRLLALCAFSNSAERNAPPSPPLKGVERCSDIIHHHPQAPGQRPWRRAGVREPFTGVLTSDPREA